MKNPWEWDENDFLEIINAGTQESIDLDFKRSGALQNVRGQKDVRYEISKDVSALANSAGGTLIYGIVENGHIATGLDAGLDPTVVTKEWLQQIITSTIHRKIDGVRINQVALTTQSQGNVAYVVYIPQSMRTPHQALDKRFYKRHEFESVAMEEYEVRDLYRRGEVPDLRIQFDFLKTGIVRNRETGMFEPFALNGGIFNDAVEPAKYAIIRILIDARLKVEQAHDFTVREGASLFLGDKEHPVTSLTLNWGVPNKMPIFQLSDRLSLTYNSEPFLLRTSTDGLLEKPASYLVGYEIDSPRMPQKSAYTLLYVKSGYATLSDEYLSVEELIANYDKLEL